MMRYVVCALLLIACVAVSVRAERDDTEDAAVEERTYGLAGIETVEPVFVEESAEASVEASAETSAEGFPIPLTKRQRRSTIEPSYLGERKHKVKAWVAPEYGVRKPQGPHKGHRKHKHPRVFTSHYFSPMPKPKKGERYPPVEEQGHKRRHHHRRHNNSFVPVTPAGHEMGRRGYVVPEIVHRLPNKIEPRDRSKITLTPAPRMSLIELGVEAEADQTVDTSAEAEAESEEAAEGPSFSEEEMGDRHEPTMLTGSQEFFTAGFQAPDWSDEAADSEESAPTDAASADAETDEFNALNVEQSLIESAAAAHEEDEEEAEDEEESEDEEEAEEEDEEEAEDEEEEEADEESEDEEEAEDEEADEEESEEEADEESEEEESEEAEEEEEQEPSLLEVNEDAADVSTDELAQNELIAQQIDMDATADDVSHDRDLLAEHAAAEQSTSEETDTQELSEDEMDSNEALAELVETEALDNSVDTLLAEVDAHLATNAEDDSEHENENESESDSESETESDSEAKGTPGHAVAAGQTWDEAKASAAAEEEAQEAAAHASAPKVAARVVSSTADLKVAAADMQTPEFDSAPVAEAEAAPQMVEALPEQTAQMVLLEKIAKLKALRRN